MWMRSAKGNISPAMITTQLRIQKTQKGDALIGKSLVCGPLIYYNIYMVGSS